MLQTVMGVTESKTSPRHLNYLKQLKKTTEMMSLLSFSFQKHQGTQRVPRNTLNSSKYTTYIHITIRSLGIASGLRFFFHGRRQILMDSHPYSYETSIFTLGNSEQKKKKKKKNMSFIAMYHKFT